MIIKKDKKVVVALSGGVDSSVSALLLKKRGFLVEGAFMRLWPKGGNLKAEEKAKKVAETLSIPLHIIDIEEEFKEKVVDSFLTSLENGFTPNPCVICNREIKFGILFEKVKADYLATGHYIKLKKGRLFISKDKDKEQSYFLWKIKKEVLSRLMFPLGDYKKEKVRQIAKKFNLPTAENEESQEICFISKDIYSFLKERVPSSPGEIVDSFGNSVGQHEGLFNYTIGQRKGLNLSNGPYYVFGKNVKENTLIVTKNEKELYKKEFSYSQENFLREVPFPFKAKVKIRYRSSLVSAKVEKGKVTLSLVQRGVTPGQSVVFYRRNELIGGGIITF